MHHAINTYGEGVIAPHICNLGNKWTSFVNFMSGERASCTHWLGGYVHPAANLETAGMIKVSAAAGIQTPFPQLFSPQPGHCIA